MAAAFQTIPLDDPSMGAFKLTVDDNLVIGNNIPAKGTTYLAWDFGQKERVQDSEWNDYIFVERQEAAAGRTAFVFAKAKSTTVDPITGLSPKDTPFETEWNNMEYDWPAVLEYVEYFLRAEGVSQQQFSGQYTYLVKSGTRQESLIKIETYMDANPWDANALRHIKPIADDVDLQTEMNRFPLRISNCLHGDLVTAGVAQTGEYFPTAPIIRIGKASPGARPILPRTNFTDWAPFVLSDKQEKQNGIWTRRKVTIFPPIQSKRKIG